MKTYAKWLNEKEQKIFTEVFYDLAPSKLKDEYLLSVYPWGCPWTYIPYETLEGDTIEEMAKNFYLNSKDEIFLYEKL